MTWNQRTIGKIFFVVILSFAPPLYLYSQVTGGTGADSSGTMIPNAQIPIVNVATAVTQTVTTDAPTSTTARPIFCREAIR